MEILLIPLFAFITVFLVVVAFMAPKENETQARLRAYGHTVAGASGDLQQSFVRRVIWPVFQKAGERLSRLAPDRVQESIRLRLHQAGSPLGLTVARFLALRVIAAVVPAALLGLAILRQEGPATPFQLLTLAVLVLGGWRIPDTWLSFKITARISKIQKALPDAIDLIVVCVEAGHGLEPALKKVAETTTGPLADELGRTLAEISLGARRRDALHSLVTRANVPDLQTFIAAILQADQMGVSIASALRVQAEAMRIRRRQRAQEATAKAPVKMLLPMVGMIFPALFAVLLGPAALKMIEVFGKGF